MISFTSRVQAHCGEGQDRVAVKSQGSKSIIVLADGAGGVYGGEEAATFVVKELTSNSFPQLAVVLVDSILEMDTVLMQSPTMGETTVVLIAFEGIQYTGVVVGDSEVYSYRSGLLSNLAEHKEVKPMLGSGACFPATFHGELTEGRILVCSDGLSKYSNRTNICSSLVISNLEDAADSLLNSVKLPNGNLQDDVSFVLIENNP